MLHWEDDLPLGSPLPSLEGATDWLHRRPEIPEGKAVLVHFWTVSATYSVQELPRLSRWAAGYPHLLLVGVHLPLSERDLEPGPVTAVAQEMHIIHPIAMDNEHALKDAFGVKGVPSYFLFDASGTLRYHQLGPGSETLSRAVEEVMILATPPE